MGIWESDIRKEASQEGYEAGVATGLAQGLKRGMEQGIAQGFEQGIYKKSVEAALVLIRNYNVPAETAAQQMGAPLDMVLTELERTDVN